MFDLVYHQGGTRKAEPEIRAEIARRERASGKKLGEQERLEIIAEERAKKTHRRWRADALSRRLFIIRGEPTTVTLSGVTSKRTLRLDLEKDLGIGYDPWDPGT